MLGWLVRRQMAKFERNFDYDLTYARDIYDASPRAFFRFSRISGLAEHREEVPERRGLPRRLQRRLLKTAVRVPSWSSPWLSVRV